MTALSQIIFTLRHGSSALSSFENLVAAAFALNLGYAALVEFVRERENSLTTMIERMADHFRGLSQHDPELALRISFGSVRRRSANRIEYLKLRSQFMVRRMMWIAAFAAFLCGCLLFVAGIWQQLALPNSLILAASLALFSPVPIGIFRANRMTRQVQDAIYDEFAYIYSPYLKLQPTYRESLREDFARVRTTVRDQS